MSNQLTGYKVFIASPGGLEDERRAFAQEITDYNRIEAVHRGVMFQAVGWEDTLPGIGRPQSLINEELEQCDYFILILHDRWGSNPGVNMKNASSGTEEEFLIAMDCFHKENHAMKQIVCLFKSVPPNQLVDPGPQLQKVIEFKTKIQDEKELLYSNFSSIKEFKDLIRRNLSKWLRDDNSIEGGYVFPTDPSDLLDSLSTKSKIDSTTIIDIDLKNTLDNAWILAKEGKIVEAEIEFSKALINEPSENQLLHFSNFLISIGQLEKANIMLERAIHLANSGNNLLMKAHALSYKGIILTIRGDLDGAEEMHKKSLKIDEKLGHIVGVADQYGNLGNILFTRGDLDGAEELFKKSLAIDEKLKRIESMAIQNNNLGNVLYTRGDLDGAEEFYKKSLEIDEKQGHLKGMAIQYGNLGNIKQDRGDLDGAEEMLKKSLAIDEKLGYLKGMAIQYGNLGKVLYTRGNLDKAEEMLNKSLSIDEKQGHLEGMAANYGNLGNIKQDRGDLDGAEELFKKSLEIEEKLGHLIGMANQYGNLGNVLKTKGDMDIAEEMYKKSLKIDEKLGNLEGIATGYLDLGNVLLFRGEMQAAEEMYKMSITIAKKAGFKQIIKVVNKNIDIIKNSKRRH